MTVETNGGRAPGEWLACGPNRDGVMAHFDAGLCPCCGERMYESSPGWVRCSTSYASGPRSDGSDPIEYQIADGLWFVRRCATLQPVPPLERISAVPSGTLPPPRSWTPINLNTLETS